MYVLLYICLKFIGNVKVFIFIIYVEIIIIMINNNINYNMLINFYISI